MSVVLQYQFHVDFKNTKKADFSNIAAVVTNARETGKLNLTRVDVHERMEAMFPSRIRPLRPDATVKQPWIFGAASQSAGRGKVKSHSYLAYLFEEYSYLFAVENNVNVGGLLRLGQHMFRGGGARGQENLMIQFEQVVWALTKEHSSMCLEKFCFFGADEAGTPVLANLPLDWVALWFQYKCIGKGKALLTTRLGDKKLAAQVTKPRTIICEMSSLKSMIDRAYNTNDDTNGLNPFAAPISRVLRDQRGNASYYNIVATDPDFGAAEDSDDKDEKENDEPPVVDVDEDDECPVADPDDSRKRKLDVAAAPSAADNGERTVINSTNKTGIRGNNIIDDADNPSASRPPPWYDPNIMIPRAMEVFRVAMQLVRDDTSVRDVDRKAALLDLDKLRAYLLWTLFHGGRPKENENLFIDKDILVPLDRHGRPIVDQDTRLPKFLIMKVSHIVEKKTIHGYKRVNANPNNCALCPVLRMVQLYLRHFIPNGITRGPVFGVCRLPKTDKCQLKAWDGEVLNRRIQHLFLAAGYHHEDRLPNSRSSRYVAAGIAYRADRTTPPTTRATSATSRRATTPRSTAWRS